MPIKFFCDVCGEDFTEEISNQLRETFTVAQVEKICKCDRCLTNRNYELFPNRLQFTFSRM